MIKTCDYVTTNSADATLVACTKAGYFCGAVLAGGVGTLSIKEGTATFLTLKTTADLDTVSFSPTVPVIISSAAGLNAAMSGTGMVTLCFAAIG